MSYRKNEYNYQKKKKKNNNQLVEKYAKVDEKDKSKKSYYRNPIKSRVGKIIIVVLALLMAFSGLFSLIYILATR